MNEHHTSQASDSQSRFRRFLPPLIAIILTLSAAAGYTYFVQPRILFPSDALIIQTHGYNDKALAALRTAGIPEYGTVDTNQIRQASAVAAVRWAIRFLVTVFIIYFCVLALLRRLIQ